MLQIVGVVDPLKLGYDQMAMIGVRCEGDHLLEAARSDRRAARGHLRRGHRGRLRPARGGRVPGQRGAAGVPRRASCDGSPAWSARRRSSTCASSSSPSTGAPDERPAQPARHHRRARRWSRPLPRLLAGAALVAAAGLAGGLDTAGLRGLRHRQAPGDSGVAGASRSWCCTGWRSSAVSWAAGLAGWRSATRRRSRSSWSCSSAPASCGRPSPSGP